MAKYKGQNAHAQAHFRYYQDAFDVFLDRAVEKLCNFLAETKIDDFYPGDFRQQAARAAEMGGGVAAFPPTYKGGYERLYKFVDENTEWTQPEYGLWDPADLEPWVQELDEARIPYAVIADKLFETMKPVTAFFTATHKPVYCYAGGAKASVRRDHYKSTPFRYTPVDPAKLTAKSTVTVTRAASEHMNFLKDQYLARGIAHTSGMANFMVWIDGALAGGFIFSQSKYGSQHDVYMLSDFSIVRERKISKLIAMMATSRAIIGALERSWLMRVERVYTTAFTDKPVSMKYRGAFELVARKPGMLNYASKVRDGSPQDIYRDWFKRHAGGS